MNQSECYIQNISWCNKEIFELVSIIFTRLDIVVFIIIIMFSLNDDIMIKK